MRLGLRTTALNICESIRLFLASCLKRIKTFVRFLLYKDSQPIQPKDQATIGSATSQTESTTSYCYPYKYPLTQAQRKKKRSDFIASLNPQKISTLASQHNNNKTCRIIESRSGSYNVSFFVEFSDGERRVVRIPISPLISDVQSKSDSEIATMQYVREHTSIPISEIFNYGKCDSLSDDTCESCWFMILEYIPGQSLSIQEMQNRPASEQHRFHSELDSILSQLWNLKFNRPGSLFLNDDNYSEPLIGPLQSLVENDLEVDTGRPCSKPHLTSVSDMLHYLHSVMQDFFTIPCENSILEALECEIFAVDDLGAFMHTAFNSCQTQDSFSLTHMDLRCENIIVNNELHIVGIIDWEWSMILPRQLCVRPLWVDEARGQFEDPLPDNFDSSYITELVAHALLDPRLVTEIYFRYIFPRRYKEPFATVASFFFRHPHQQMLLQAKQHTAIKYEEFLKDNNLFVQDEEIEKYRQWLQDTDKLLNDT